MSPVWACFLLGSSQCLLSCRLPAPKWVEGTPAILAKQGANWNRRQPGIYVKMLQQRLATVAWQQLPEQDDIRQTLPCLDDALMSALCGGHFVAYLAVMAGVEIQQEEVVFDDEYSFLKVRLARPIGVQHIVFCFFVDKN